MVFANSTGINIANIEVKIRQKLIDGTWFYAEQWGLPSIIDEHFSIKDPTWHEFETVELTGDTGETDISDFLNNI